jgi:hypothetical protein
MSLQTCTRLYTAVLSRHYVRSSQPENVKKLKSSLAMDNVSNTTNKIITQSWLTIDTHVLLIAQVSVTQTKASGSRGILNHILFACYRNKLETSPKAKFETQNNIRQSQLVPCHPLSQIQT